MMYVFLVLVGGIHAAVPNDHLARPVLPGRDHALERSVVVRVVLRLHGEPPLGRIEGWASRNGPRFQDPLRFEPEVVVELPGRMLLHDEEQRPRARSERGRGLGSRFEYALGRIFAEGRGGLRRVCALTCGGPGRRGGDLDASGIWEMSVSRM